MTGKKNIFNIGDKIEIVKITSKGKKSYPSQVLDITDEGVLIISGPIHKNKLVMLHKDEKIKISYIIENKGRYAFSAIILKKEYKGIYKLEIKKVSEIKRYQQRKYYRFPISIVVTKEIVSEEKIITEECKTIDISGDGLKICSNFQHSLGDVIRCKFEINRDIIDVNGKVLRIEKIDRFDYKYCLGIAFMELSELDRDKIIKFIFLKERLLREKELI